MGSVAPARPNFLFQAFRTSQLAGSVLADAIAATGLRGDEFAVQSAIGVMEPVTPSELAAFTGMGRTTLSSLLARMAERGHVDRTPNPRDGRSYLLTLTPAGRSAVEQGFPGLAESIEAVERRLTVDPEDVHAALAALQEAFRAVVAERAANLSRSTES